MKQRQRILLALWQLVLFVGFQMSVMLFTHIHVVNGVAIAHSHPFADAHEHEADNYILLAQLSQFESLEAVSVDVPKPILPLQFTIEALPNTPMYVCNCFEHTSLRAPPYTRI